jgi:hypothetical protein
VNLPGATTTLLVQINDNGAFTGSYVPTGHPRQLAGFIDEHGHVTSFSHPTPAFATQPAGINNQGTVVGFSQHGHSPYQGWLRSPSGRFTPINDPLGGAGAFQGTKAESMNDHGVVAGVYITSRNVYHGFIYRSGRFSTVNVPGGFYGQAYRGSEIFGINNAGVMVGPYNRNRKNVTLGYEEAPAYFAPFTGPGGGARPGDATYANAISNAGVIVGTGSGPSGVQQGWTLSGCDFTRLQDPRATTAPSRHGLSGTIPDGINRSGVVVGYYYDARHFPHGFLVRTGITAGTSQARCLPGPTAPPPAGGAAQLAPASRLARPAR